MVALSLNVGDCTCATGHEIVHSKHSTYRGNVPVIIRTHGLCPCVKKKTVPSCGKKTPNNYHNVCPPIGEDRFVWKVVEVDR